ncbi:MAG: hypothetical protein EXR58_08325 [Chloroflexi bacterium]|nr:hypothetical protein [Chloroflexota bacterium]
MSREPVETTTTPGLTSFAEGVRARFEQASTLSELLRQLSAQMREALRDPGLAPSDHWVYNDLDDLFQISAGVSGPMHETGPHDHGEHWVVYGVRKGAIETIRYERLDDGSDGDNAEIKPVRQYVMKAGDVDVIEPWGIHNQNNTTTEPALNFVVRGYVGPIWRNRFDLEGKRVIRVGGRD